MKLNLFPRTRLSTFDFRLSTVFNTFNSFTLNFQLLTVIILSLKIDGIQLFAYV